LKVHEDFSRSIKTKRTSDRAFGYTVGAVLILLGTARSAIAHAWSVWPFALGLLLLTLAALRPSLLGPVNRVWTAVGLLLSKVMNPIFTGILFFLVVAPIGLILRLFGKDLLQVARNKESKTYWIERKPPGPPPMSMTQQF
jgi:hypothetical protein